MDFRMKQGPGITAEKRGWLRGPHGVGPGDNPSIVLDLTKFTKNTHYPDGFVPSGCVVGKVTATGMYGPYDNAATDGRETAAGLLFASETVNDGQARATAAMVIHGMIDPDRLPFKTGTGSLDAAGRTDLPNIITT